MIINKNSIKDVGIMQYKFTNEIKNMLAANNFKSNKRGTSFYLKLNKNLAARLSNHYNTSDKFDNQIINFKIKNDNDIIKALSKLNKKFKKLNLITTL